MRLSIQITLYVMALVTFVAAFNSKKPWIACVLIPMSVFMLYSIGWVQA